jgi:ABC-2 type transport system permease protein
MNLSPSLTRLQHEATRAWAIAEKDIRIYYAKPPVLMWGIMLPFFMFLSWSVGRNKPTGALIPGLVAITVFFTASSIGPVIIPWEKRVRTFERLLAAPVSLTAVLLGKTLAGLIFGIAVALIPLIVGWIALGAQVTDMLTLGLTLLLAAGAFSSLGVLFSTMPGRDVGSVMMPATLIRWPLLFISGLFIPLGDLGEWGLVVSFISPLTFANDALNGAMGGTAYYTPILNLTMLAAFWGLFVWAGLRLHEWGRRTES